VSRRILIVDDSESNRNFLKETVEEMGFIADCAPDGLSAVELATRSEYALILMDIFMPVLDGKGATRNIADWQALHRIAPTPIVAMTAGATEQECLQAGMNGYLRKPTTADELIQFLNDWFAKADTEVSGGFKCTIDEVEV
jgi:CheY-like chemotaxis protein